MKLINKNFKFLINHLKVYKWQIIWQIFCAIISGLGAVVAIVAIQFAIDGLGTGDLARVSLVCGIILGFYFLNSFIQYSQYYVNALISQRISKKIRNDLLLKLNRLPIKYFDKNQTGDIMSKFINDINNINIFLTDNFSDLLGALAWTACLAIAMIVISWQLSIIALALIALSIYCVWIVIKKSMPYFTELQKNIGEFTGFIEEKIAGQNIIDLFEQQKLVKENFNIAMHKVANTWEKAQRTSFFNYPMIDFLVNSITVFMIGLASLFIIFDVPGVFPINISTSANQVGVIGSLTIFILVFRNVLTMITQLPSIVNVATSTNVGIKRIMEIMEEKDEYTPYEHLIISIASLHRKVNNVSNDTKIINPSIEFKNVNFSYDDKTPVLKNISFNIPAGSFIGIVGPTGSGKTTIINLLTKLYEINGGEILIGDTPINQINRDSLRQNISIVLQDTFFFNQSIIDNLMVANPHATKEQIIYACKQAQCHDIIMQLPNQYDTIVSSTENKLSKGQKQLIAIARAILSDNNLVILDEATSSVDVNTEVLVQKAMETLLKNKTAILIAHRLSTIRNADKILVIKNGELIEQGNHEELMSTNGFYAQLNNSQFNIID